MTRARKRLRGEPVSPSPVKDKRARVGSQRALNFSSTLLDSDDEDTRLSHADGAADETFLEATPMKPPTGGKSFRVLFDEVLPTPQDASRQPTTRTLSRTTSTAPRPNVFSNKRARTRAMSPSSSEDDIDSNGWANGTKLQSLITSANGFHAVKKPAAQQMLLNGRGRTLPVAVLPARDNLRTEKGPRVGPRDPTRGGKTPSGSADAISVGRSTGKRPRSDSRDASTGGDGADGSSETKKIDHVLFLPPSPPRPEDSRFKASNAFDKGKGKASAAAFSRKKARLLEQLGGKDAGDDSEDSEEDEDHVKLREHSWNAPRRQTAIVGDELDDPDFQWPARPLHGPNSPSLGPVQIEEGVVEVNLREDLKRILALSPERRTEEEERRMANAVLYGRREGHCDAKGVEVWDVGEMSEGAEGIRGDGEDDWEGEPVPWEVGEL